MSTSHSRKTNRLALLFWGGLIVLVGCAVTLRRPAPGPATVVAAKARPTTQVVTTVGGPRIPHPKHLDLGLECTDCHEMGDEGPGYPEVDFCLDCHGEMQDDDDVPAADRVENKFFSDGKPRWVKGIQSYPAEIRFDHKKHAGVACTACHDNLDQVPRHQARLFTMNQCTSCHRERNATTTCAVCHPAYRQDVAPASHQQGWELGHGREVRSAEAGGLDTNCSYCHDSPNFCNECHFTQAPGSHFQNWELAHGKRVRSAGGPGEARCTFCHTTQSFCDDCHMNTKPSSHRGLWLRRHGTLWRAENVDCNASCRFCHDQPSFCEDCHRDMKPQDHTALFRQRTHGLQSAIDRTRCTYCHETDFCVRCHESTPPMSHRGMWSRGRNLHCVQCHFPVASEPECRACHHQEPTHDTAPAIPGIHPPGLNCRICHNAVGGGGAPPLRHVDNGGNCLQCHH